MKILIVTDAWKPQTNGVVRTYEYLSEALSAQGHEVRVIGPGDFPHRMPMPGYREIELVLFPYARMKKLIGEAAPDTIHIGTEGPLGHAARRYCLKNRRPFTTCYHTHFPDYAAQRVAKYMPPLAPFVRQFFINGIRAFHKPSSALMLATPSLEKTLRSWHFNTPFYRLTRGVAADRFSAERKNIFTTLPKPVAIYVGRVAVEKNLKDFLSMPWTGSKVIVGDGPDFETLRTQFPGTLFTGKKTGADLIAHYQSADVFVFPSRTETFGMVLLEALSCGLPVAAYPATGPVDIITELLLGTLSENLEDAAQQALAAPGTREDRHAYVRDHYTWAVAARQFLEISKESGAVINQRSLANPPAAR